MINRSNIVPSPTSTMAETQEPEYDDELRKKHQFLYGVTYYLEENLVEILKGKIPLHYVITKEDPVTLRWLGQIGDTALHIGARKHSSAIRFLLKYSYDFTVKNLEGDTALHVYLKRKYFYIYQNYKYYNLDYNNQYKGVNYVLRAHVDKNVVANPVNKDGLSHFHVACIFNHTEAVEFFLKNGVSPNLPIEGYTPLQLMINSGNYEMAQILVGHNADVNLKNSEGHTLIQQIQNRNRETVEVQNFNDNRDILSVNIRIAPLVTDSKLIKFHMACLADSTDEIAKLLKSNTFNVDEADEAGYTGLHWAMHAKYDFSDVTTVKLLLEHKANVLKKNHKNLTALDIFTHKCHSYNGLEILSIIEKETNLLLFADEKLREAFYSIFDNEKLEKLLKTQEVNVNAVCISNGSKIWPGFTLLHAAASLPINNSKTHTSECKKTYNQPDYRSTVELLVEYNADMTIPDTCNRTPVHLGFYNNHEATLKFLLSRYPEEIRSNPTDSNGLSHFHVACMTRNCELVERFILSKTVSIDDPILADINEYKAGSTAPQIAAINKDNTMISLLLKHRVSLFTKNADNTSLLESLNFFYSSQQEISEVLMSEPNIVDRTEDIDSTSLSHFYVACSIGNYDVVKSFLRQGANPFAPNVTDSKHLKGYTPLHFAFKNNQWLNIKILLNHNPELSLSKPDAISLLQLVFDRFNYNCRYREYAFGNIKKIFELPVFEDKCLKFVNELGITQLHVACILSNVSKVESLLLSGENPNARVSSTSSNWPGCSPLQLVAQYHLFNKESSCRVVELLLKHGAEVSIEDNSILCNNRFLLKTKDSDNKDCSMLASTVLECYFKFDKVIPGNPNQVFYLACQNNHAGLVEKMLRDYRISFYWSIDTPLHVAAKHNSKEVVAILLKLGHEVDVRDARLRTPLFYAINNRKDDIVDTINQLIRYGADVNAKDHRELTPLCYSLDQIDLDNRLPSQHFSKAVKLLLNHGACIIETEFVCTRGRKNFIQSPVRYGCVKLLRTIISEAKDILELDDDGKMHPFRNVSVLKDHYVNLVHELLKRGADLNCQDGKGNTSLHHAVLENSFRNNESVSALLTCGADPNLVNEEGKTAMECADKNSLPIIANYIVGMNILKLDVSDQNQKCLENTAETDEKLIIDLSELEELKKLSVNESTTFYNVLVDMCLDEVLKLIPNEILESKLRSVGFYIEFPKLAGFLNLKYYQARRK